LWRHHVTLYLAIYLFSTVLDTAQETSPTANSTLLLRCDKKAVQVTQTSGTIRSPDYPQAYGTDLRCTWHVKVPSGFRIKVRFRRQFDIEKSPGCSKDHIMLSTTKNFRNPLIYCGKVRPHGIITPQNSVWIRFHSDNATTGRGFYISYMAVGKPSSLRPLSVRQELTYCALFLSPFSRLL